MRRVYEKDVCEGLDEVLNPDWCSLLIVDMQNDAVKANGKIPAAGNDVTAIAGIVPRCQALLAEARQLGILVVHIRVLTLRDGRSDSPSWIRTKGAIVNESEFFLEDTWGAEFIDELKPMPGELVVTKHRSSAFVGTDLDMLLRSSGIATTVVIGEQTPGCVEATYRDAAYHDYYNVLVEDCVAAFDQAQHEASLLIQRARHDVCTADEVIRIWRQAKGGAVRSAEPAATAAMA
jgi:biuret amidohydrolase